MKHFKLLFVLSLVLLFHIMSLAQNRPQISFEELLVQSEENPYLKMQARNSATETLLPWSIYLPEGIFIEALSTEDAKPVYSVITNMLNPYDGGYTAFFDEIALHYDLSNARIHYSKTNVVNPNLGFPQNFSENNSGSFLLFMESTGDRVISLDINTGDVIDLNYIPPDGTNLATPKQARLTPWGNITISDQLSDGVFEYDTLGTVLGLFAPSGGVNTGILDNVRGHNYRNNTGNLLVTVAAGGNINSVAEFDNAGNFVGQFIATGAGGLNSPYDILFRTNDVIVTASSSDALHQYDLNGNFIANLYSGVSANFFQQIHELPNGDLIVADFGVGGGVQIFSPTGTLQTTLGQITALRGVYQLTNGNILVSNAAGLFEINPVTGDTLRQIIAGASGQYITPYDLSIVPVELTSFFANIFDGNVVLNWSTATEINNSGFEIQRSRDNSNFSNLSFVDGYGTTSDQRSYSFTDNTVSSGIYYYRLKQIDHNGSFEYSNVIEVQVGAPDNFALEQNYPNPFNPSTMISYQLPVNGSVTLKIFDVLGNEVTTLVNEFKEAGKHSVEFDASNMGSGIYFYTMSAGNFTSSKKMILIK
jgi:hypothetical protein